MIESTFLCLGKRKFCSQVILILLLFHSYKPFMDCSSAVHLPFHFSFTLLFENKFGKATIINFIDVDIARMSKKLITANGLDTTNVKLVEEEILSPCHLRKNEMPCAIVGKVLTYQYRFHPKRPSLSE